GVGAGAPGGRRRARGGSRPGAPKAPGCGVWGPLPRLARVMDKLCLVRSMAHRMNVHGPACSEVFSGRPYFGPPITDQASREDWPALSAMVQRYGQGQRGLPPAVVLPWYLQFPGQPRRIAGQTGGRMGERHNAFLLSGEIGRADFEIEGLRLNQDLPMNRLHERRALLHRLETGTSPRPEQEAFAAGCRSVYQLLENKASAVLDLRREPD